MTENYGNKSNGPSRILIYGFGNPGRRDDGLGPVFVERLEFWARENKLENLSFETAYQLNIEDALMVSEFDVVIFADADTEGGPFRFDVLRPAAAASFSTHEMPPEAVLALCGQLYSRVPEARILGIRGYSWETGEGLSEAAAANLHAALEHLKTVLAGPLDVF